MGKTMGYPAIYKSIPYLCCYEESGMIETEQGCIQGGSDCTAGKGSQAQYYGETGEGNHGKHHTEAVREIYVSVFPMQYPDGAGGIYKERGDQRRVKQRRKYIPGKGCVGVGVEAEAHAFPARTWSCQAPLGGCRGAPQRGGVGMVNKKSEMGL